MRGPSSSHGFFHVWRKKRLRSCDVLRRCGDGEPEAVIDAPGPGPQEKSADVRVPLSPELLRRRSRRRCCGRLLLCSGGRSCGCRGRLLRRCRRGNRRCRGRLLLFRFLLVVMAVVLRLAIGGLSGLRGRLVARILCRGGSGLRCVLCHYRQGHGKRDEWSEDNSIDFL